MVPTGLYFLLGSNLLVALGRIDGYNEFEVANRYVGLGAIAVVAWLWGTPETVISAVAISVVVMCLPVSRELHLWAGLQADPGGYSKWIWLRVACLFGCGIQIFGIEAKCVCT